jgi:uncharacterized protein
MKPTNKQLAWSGPLWDTHVHLFPEKLMQAIYHFFRESYRWDLPFPTAPAALMEHLLKDGVEQAFVLAYVHKPEISRQVNRWLADLTTEHRWLIPFGAVHPQDSDLEQILAEALDLYHFAGIKLHCLVQQISPDDQALFPVYEALVKRSRGLIIHAGNFPLPDKKRLGVQHMAGVLRKYPRLNVIVAHLGLYDLSAYRELLKQYRGLYLDTAFVFQNENFIPLRQEIADFIKEFPDRILYGSDFPFILEPPINGISRILDLGLPPSLYPRLFYDNARQFLKAISSPVE